MTSKGNAFCKEQASELDVARIHSHLSTVRNKYARHTENNLAATVAASQRQTAAAQPFTWLTRIRQSMQLVKRSGKDNVHPAAPHPVGTAMATISLKNEDDQSWHGPITLGGKTFEIEFDTGSGDLLVNKSAYTPSSSAKKTSKTYKAAFGDGTVAKGRVYLDTLAIGGVRASDVAIGKTDTDFIEPDEGFSGIAGMAFRPIAETHSTPFFDKLVSAGVLAKPEFAFKLGGDTPTLTFGGLPADIKATPTWFDVDASHGFWSTACAINGLPINAIVDTGTTLIVVPVPFAKKLFAQLKLETFTRDVTLYAIVNDKSPPQIKVQFDGSGGRFSCTLPTDTLTYGTAPDGKPLLSIVGTDLGADMITLGGAFLRNVIAVFSREQAKTQIGFLQR